MGETKSRFKPVQIDPMNNQELQKMLLYRWQVAGGKEEDFLFRVDDTEAFRVLYTYTVS